MSFKRSQFDDSVNVTHHSPFSELFKLLVQLLIVFSVLFLVLELALRFFIPFISPQLETKIFGVIYRGYLSQTTVPPDLRQKQERLQRLFDALPAQSKPEGYEYQVVLEQEKQPNAYAVPGGLIIVTTGMADLLRSENAMAFVLGHELGHFEHRDHLYGTGRSLLVSGIIQLFLGVDGGNGVQALSHLFTSHYSREQEYAADIWGLKLLKERYGHAGGAMELFETLKTHYGRAEWLNALSTHPLSDDRIHALEREIKLQQMVIRPVVAY